MSFYDYEVSKSDALYRAPFYALLMAAMRRADSDNAELLKHAFPYVWSELYVRYHAPGGLLAGEVVTS